MFAWLGRHVDEVELRRVFNLGVGYAAVCASAVFAVTWISSQRLLARSPFKDRSP